MQQGEGTPQQLVALGRPDRPGVGDAVPAEVRLDLRAEVGLVLHDAGDHEREPRAVRHLDRPVRPLVGVDPPEEQQVGAGPRPEGEGTGVDAVVDGRGVGQAGVAVGVADRDVVRDVAVGGVDPHDALGGEPVHRRDHRGPDQPAVGQRQEVELVGQHVELRGALEGRPDVQALLDLGVEGAVLLVAGGRLRVQPSCRRGVGGGEQRHLVAERHQPLGQGGGHLLPWAVAARRGAVRDRGEDADAHRQWS